MRLTTVKIVNTKNPNVSAIINESDYLLNTGKYTLWENRQVTVKKVKKTMPVFANPTVKRKLDV